MVFIMVFFMVSDMVSDVVSDVVLTDHTPNIDILIILWYNIKKYFWGRQ